MKESIPSELKFVILYFFQLKYLVQFKQSFSKKYTEVEKNHVIPRYEMQLLRRMTRVSFIGERRYSILIKFRIHKGIDRVQIANELVKCPIARRKWQSNSLLIIQVQGSSRVRCTCARRFAFVPLLRTGGDCLRYVRSIARETVLQPTVEVLPGIDRNVSITENDPLKSRLRNRIFRNVCLFARKRIKNFTRRADAFNTYVTNDFFWLQR